MAAFKLRLKVIVDSKLDGVCIVILNQKREVQLVSRKMARGWGEFQEEQQKSAGRQRGWLGGGGEGEMDLKPWVVLGHTSTDL